jgi:hypothetical protein
MPASVTASCLSSAPTILMRMFGNPPRELANDLLRSKRMTHCNSGFWLCVQPAPQLQSWRIAGVGHKKTLWDIFNQKRQ